jgi:hypothetical protein
MEPKLSDINFFISSTYDDMKEYRSAVIKHIQSRAGIINAQEFFGARDKKPLETCLEELGKSQVFVMFLGQRYGSVDQVSGKSFVECEYDRACELGLPRLVYIIDENQPVPSKYFSKGTDAERLSTFKTRVQSVLTVNFFTTPDDLALKVYSDLIRELPKHNFTLGKETLDEQQESTIQTLKEFNVLPKLFHGRTVSFKARLGRCIRASENECDAFGYDYGAALKRSCTPVDTSIQQALSNADRVFAYGDAATRLIKIPENEEIWVTVKTMQGEYTIREAIYGYKHEPGLFDAAAFLSRQFESKRRVIVDFNESINLICGLELVETSQN